MVNTMPTRASKGVKDMGLSSWTKKLPLSMPARLRIHAVTVVPILAPMITLMACFRLMRPELTKPTTITVVAEEDWITPVTARPVSSPAILPVVRRLSRPPRRLPARRSKASPMVFMPKRNKQSPPSMVSTSKKFILRFHLSIFQTFSLYRAVFGHIHKKRRMEQKAPTPRKFNIPQRAGYCQQNFPFFLCVILKTRR